MYYTNPFDSGPTTEDIDMLIKYKDQDNKIRYIALHSNICGNIDHWEITDKFDIHINEKFGYVLDLTKKLITNRREKI